MKNVVLESILNCRKQEFIDYCLEKDKKFDNFSFPKLYNNLALETVFIEFRLLPHISFIIKNAINILGNKWSYTIICGELNYDFIKNIVVKNNMNIRIIKKNITNMTREEYSIMLLKSEFWEQFLGKKILIYQEDTLVFKKLDNIFLKYDFIGAPYYNKNIGNGGLSLRSKDIMIYICEKYFNSKRKRFKQISNFIKHQKKNKLNYNYLLEKSILEDLQITDIMRRYNIGKLPDFKLGKKFSIEKYFDDDSFGGHQFWYCVKDIKLFLENRLNY